MRSKRQTEAVTHRTREGKGSEQLMGTSKNERERMKQREIEREGEREN